MVFGSRTPKKPKKVIDYELLSSAAASQHLLLKSATETAIVATDVATTIRTKLADSIEQLESTVKILSDALIVVDESGKITGFNPAAERIFSWPTSEILNKSVLQLFAMPNNDQIELKDFWNLLEAEECWDIAGPFDEPPTHLIKGKRRSGESFLIDVKLTKMIKNDNTVMIMILVCDLQDDIETKQKMFRYEQRYRSLFDNSFDGTLIIQDSKIVAANKAITRVLGYTPEEMVNKKIQDFICPEYHSIIESHHLRHMHGYAGPETYNLVGVAKSSVKFEMMISSVLIKWDNKNASLITIKDISEMNRLETALKQNEKRFKAMVEDSPDFVIGLDSKFRITYANKAYLAHIGRFYDDVIGESVFSRLPDHQQEGYKQHLLYLNIKKPFGRIHCYATNKEGKRVIQDWIDQATFDEAGNVTGYHCVGRDISELLNSLKL